MKLTNFFQQVTEITNINIVDIQCIKYIYIYIYTN